MSDSAHNVKYVATFYDKIIELGDYNIIEAKIGVVSALALMEQAKQARVKNLVDYLRSLNWADHSALIEEIRAEIERELGVGQPELTA